MPQNKHRALVIFILIPYNLKKYFEDYTETLF